MLSGLSLPCVIVVGILKKKTKGAAQRNITLAKRELLFVEFGFCVDSPTQILSLYFLSHGQFDTSHDSIFFAFLGCAWLVVCVCV